ncbi:hypothetical protein [Bradyrhizobium sp.]|uniref:hypothetical protein n=1 Tax=Bradyrhizobium sp. TaxID=376 RepID=UPI003C6FD88F
MTMTMRLKFAGTSADESFTDIFWKPLNLTGRDNVLEDRTMAHQEVRDADVRAQDLRTKGLPVMEKTPQRLVEQDALAEMLEEMSLSTLLYYVLAGEGANKDESS